MAGMDILSTVRGLFPDVTTAVDQYQATKSDRQARNLARRLGNEEALYHQFLSQLLLLSSAASAKSADEPLGAIESRLGFQSKAADSLRRDLHQMVGCLRDLKADLTNTSRGSVCSGIVCYRWHTESSDRFTIGITRKTQMEEDFSSRSPPKNAPTETPR